MSATRDQIAVVCSGDQGPVEIGLDLECIAHATQLEVPEPQVAVGEPGLPAALFENIRRIRRPPLLLARVTCRRADPTTSSAYWRTACPRDETSVGGGQGFLG